ncbi:hypothetical protein RN001_009046 [Aquatica leii]|uniref:Metalloendopeptidase n=1 Tax=Aquatica leii TaxID=1421715 RepID=A0AAN7SPQ7_9COLE|nr:hypothetical protein RN001_009046 [Aquatica leii]
MKIILFGVVAVFATVQVQSIPLPENDQNDWIHSGKFEGDMMLGHGQKNGLLEAKYRWSNREIPYEIGPEYTAAEREFIKNALSVFNQTCLKVRERVSTDKNYVLITGQEKGCWSYVGVQGGMQKLNMNQTCCCKTSTTVVHEFLHTVGFYHMQSNFNRDDYVTILYENIIKGEEFNFQKYTSNYVTDFGLPYDYGSIMHYPRKAFSISYYLDTIVPKDPTAVIGEATQMSAIDLAKIKAIYLSEKEIFAEISKIEAGESDSESIDDSDSETEDAILSYHDYEDEPSDSYENDDDMKVSLEDESLG